MDADEEGDSGNNELDPSVEQRDAEVIAQIVKELESEDTDNFFAFPQLTPEDIDLGLFLVTKVHCRVSQLATLRS
jgi:hypothetical protein